MTDWLNDAHRAGEEIRHFTRELEYISKAFYRTGNVEMADELNHISKRVNEREKIIRDAIGQSITEQLHSSQKSTDNMMCAIVETIEASEIVRKSDT